MSLVNYVWYFRNCLTQAAFSKSDRVERDLVGSVLKVLHLYQDMIGLVRMDMHQILTIDMKIS
jgi:hypothetical protein